MPKTATRKSIVPAKAAYTLTFMKEVLRANRTTGALGPSSKGLAEAVTEMARLDGAKAIVEYGPGTGVFTEYIQAHKPADAHFIAMEVNDEFVEATRKRCPDVHVYHDSAQNAIKYLNEAGYEHCDRIVSGLPWTRFPEELQDEIINAAYESLAPGGIFLTFAYATSPLVPSGRRFFMEKLPKRFPNVRKSKPVWANFPPCVVFYAQK